MTHQEYLEKLEWYRKRMKQMRANYDNLCRLDKEYCRYLEQWFSDGRCDGTPNYETRVIYKVTPMPFNVYCFE